MASVRLTRHVIELADGQPVGLAIAGRGVPFVVVHGFSAQGILYAQTLSRLVSMGFKVIAVDSPGHGPTRLPPRRPADLRAHADVVFRALDELGVRQAVLCGHSLGGRLVTEVAAADPSRVVALVLIDAIVGRPWDQMVTRLRWCPATGARLAALLAADAAMTVPMLADPSQSLKLGSLVLRSRWASHPLRLAGPALSVLLAGTSLPALERLREAGVPAVVIHGTGDLTVPLAAGRDAATRLGAELVLVRGARHTWLLRDPEMLPTIVGHLLAGSLGDAWNAALLRAGVDPARATIEDIESALLRPQAPIHELSPPLAFTPTNERRRRARYEWSIQRMGPRAMEQ